MKFCCIFKKSIRGEMDIIPAFEAVVGGSNPSGCTNKILALVVQWIKHRFPEPEIEVRFLVGAPT